MQSGLPKHMDFFAQSPRYSRFMRDLQWSTGEIKGGGVP